MNDNRSRYFSRIDGTIPVDTNHEFEIRAAMIVQLAKSGGRPEGSGCRPNSNNK